MIGIQARVLVVLACGLTALTLLAAEPAGEPKSASAKAAVSDYTAAVEKAKAACAKEIAAARETYLEQLAGAVKEAMKTGDLEEANRINTLKTVAAATPAAGAGPVFLADLEHFNVQVADFYFGKKGVIRGDEKIMVEGKYLANGICTIPGTKNFARVQFHLGAGFKRLRGRVALDDKALHAQSALTFSFLGDGKAVWTSQPVQVSKSLKAFDIPIIGVKTLELRVECPGRMNDAFAI